ncbi:2-keto-4-pentenoate hydratase [Thermanaerosceptrum fracticalcis]|uniref:2-keto-4-pentenoate hydratase n=1 Tax=Thermanaerosceptrum fracticalcis TaxID=1712410 RepID=A0A7G6E7P8_THEFR|nr:fumarylacetoacetate hydrolase family protein [Thermanaerosceptrum fracticalcis]QNB48102.1 2-keto-4-pentenoate hydratase [Thermanaerosceptrum fracticalcis]
MDKEFIVKAAEALRVAMTNKKPISALTEQKPDITIEEAYQVQLVNVEEAVKAGKRIVGKKIGLTSVAMQKFLGVNEPDYGHLLDTMIWDEEIPISLSNLLQPKIEAEIAFVLGDDLQGPGVTLTDVLRATAGVVPSFEVIDSRIKDWKIKIQDTIADNASSAGITLGSQLIPVNQVELKYVGMVLQKNGQIIETAAGAAVMGHPALAVAWLANKLGSMGIGLKKGEIILSGSLTKAIEVKAGDVFVATFGGLGSVKAVFTE